MKRFWGVAVLLFGFTISGGAVSQPYSLQFVEVFNNGSNLDVKVQMKSSGAPFTLGTSNLVFMHNNGLSSPVLLAAHNFSDSVTYEPITVTSLPGNLASINIEYLGALGSGGSVPSTYVDVVTIRFTVTNPAQPVFFTPKLALPSPRVMVYQSDEATTNSASTNVRGSLKVWLEGPYNTGSGRMNKTLNSGGHLATRYPGATIPAEAVDSISVEIRNASSAAGSTMRKFRPAWLLADGSIRDFADTTQRYVDFDTTDANYYLVVRHGNHLGIMTAGSLPLNALTSTAYNFTTSQGQAWGSSPMKEVQSGVFAMYAGDTDGSGDVGALDRTATWNFRNQVGYLGADVDLSGDVGALDRTLTWNNRNVFSQVP